MNHDLAAFGVEAAVRTHQFKGKTMVDYILSLLQILFRLCIVIFGKHLEMNGTRKSGIFAKTEGLWLKNLSLESCLNNKPKKETLWVAVFFISLFCICR